MRRTPAIFLLACAVWACSATPVPQPPSYELDVDKSELQTTDGSTVRIVGGPGAISPAGIRIRVTPKRDPDIDPILEPGSATVAADGSFIVVVSSPPANTFYFEVLEEEEDVYFAAVLFDADGNTSEGEPGPDTDADGSPDEIDCAPEDPALSGQRCP
jgi:hypothetical protein